MTSRRSQRKLGKKKVIDGIHADLERTSDVVYANAETGPEDTPNNEPEASAEEETERKRASTTQLMKGGKRGRIRSSHRSLSNARADDETSMDVDTVLDRSPRLARLDSPGGR